MTLIGVGGCSRESESPTTSHIIPGAECRSTDPWGNDTKDIGNLDIRIPVHVPGKQTEEDAIAIPGNPDIRVPDEGEAERGGRAEKAPDQAQEEEQKDASPGDNPKGRKGPEERERRHVPGGTWPSQYDVCLSAVVQDILESAGEELL
ncbi:hypothetical protein NDU88_000931 [Pleurodeles waltl]|uniref:Uncharacterized protein n=1 Tax=Pleurodeles waltl TaxID=8319 RepID=A0AAV7WL52_PLEWA|nr:hypothetical protein NDU88_000931 [Pleurodeles waltl]